MDAWRPIKTAPRDGTVIEVKNSVMREPVQAKWGPYASPFGTKSEQFILVKDYDKFMPIRPGALVVPDVWRPVPKPNV